MEYVIILLVSIGIVVLMESREKDQEQKKADALTAKKQELAKRGLSPKEIETKIHAENRKKKLDKILGEAKCPKCKKREYFPQPITLPTTNFWGEATSEFVNVPICKECKLEFVPRVILEK